MTRKRRRLALLGLSLAGLGVATGLTLSAFDDSLKFFYSPGDLLAQPQPPGRAFRLGGLVEAGSVHQTGDGATVAFTVTDGKETLPVVYRGILPDLFREGQGVVAEGSLDTEGVFVASEVLAKHDETYMPPEVAEALQANGAWRRQAATSTVEDASAAP